MEKRTATEAGFSQDDVIRMVLTTIIEKGGCATMQNIYDQVNEALALKNFTLSDQGRHSLRRLVNSGLVNKSIPFMPLFLFFRSQSSTWPE